MQNPENSTYSYQERPCINTENKENFKIEHKNRDVENMKMFSEQFNLGKIKGSQISKSESVNVSKYTIEKTNKEEFNFDEIIKNLAYPDVNSNFNEREIDLIEDKKEKLNNEISIQISEEENFNSNDILNIELSKSSVEYSNNLPVLQNDNLNTRNKLNQLENKEFDNINQTERIFDPITKDTVENESNEPLNNLNVVSNIKNEIKSESKDNSEINFKKDNNNKFEEGKKIIKLTPLNPNTIKTGNGNSTIFQSVKSNKLERDLLSKIVDDITFKKSILDNNNLIKSIKENENKNITLNLKIEMNLNLFNDKENPNPNEYKIETYAKEKTGIDQIKRETEYYINMPIYKYLNFKDKDKDSIAILNQVCNDLIGEIRENRTNDAPRFPFKSEPNKNKYFNLGKAQCTFEYLKNPNNKIESQCLLEFLNFIDFNLKNTISQDNDFTKLYSKYEFLSNNMIDEQLFFEILEEKNSIYRKFSKKEKNAIEDIRFNNKDLVLDLGLNFEDEVLETCDFKNGEKLENKFANLYNNNDKKFSHRTNLIDGNQNFYENNKNLSVNENKIKKMDNTLIFNKIKPYNGNYSINNTKTTINSQDIDIINDLQSVKINNMNINISANKNSSLKIFKSSVAPNNISTNSHTNNVNLVQNFQMKLFENDKKDDYLTINNNSENSNLNNNKLLKSEENKDFFITNNFTERVLKNENNFPDFTEILKFNILKDNLEQQLLKQKKLKEETENNKNNDIPKNINSRSYHFGDKRDILDDIDLFDSMRRKKFLIQKISNNETNAENNNANLSDQSNSNLRLSKTINKELRKFKTDSIHKKIKVNILKYIKDYVVEFVPNKKIPNLSQEIVTNVNITYNKELLEKKIIDIYKEDFDKTNTEALAGIIEVMHNKTEFNEVMNMRLKDYIINKYWKSDFHRNKLKRIYDFEPREYFLNYVSLDRDFINYFLNNRGNKKKGNKLNNKNNDNMSFSTQDLQDN